MSLTKLSQHGMSLSLRDTLGSEPFTHHAFGIQTGSLGLHTLNIIGPLPPSCGTSLRSIYALLPKPLPRSSVLRLSRLWLRNVHFRYFTDLLRLIWELPVLEYFGGTRLAWQSEATRPGALPAWIASRRAIPRLENFRLDACPSGQHSLAIPLAGRPGLYSELGILVHHIDKHLADVRSFQMYFSDASTLSERFILSALLTLY